MQYSNILRKVFLPAAEVVSGAGLGEAVDSEAGGPLEHPGGGPHAGVWDREVLARSGRLVLLLVEPFAGGHGDPGLLGGGDLGVIGVGGRSETNLIIKSFYLCFSEHFAGN